MLSSGRVVMNYIPDESEIKSLGTGGLENGEISVVRKALVDGVSDRVQGWMGSMALKEADGPFVGRPGLEHNAGARGPAGIEIDDGSDVMGPGMELDKSAGAKQATFFAIVDENDDGIFGPGQRFQRSSGFDDGSYPGTIVGNAWSCWYRIVMGG